MPVRACRRATREVHFEFGAKRLRKWEPATGMNADGVKKVSRPFEDGHQEFGSQAAEGSSLGACQQSAALFDLVGFLLLSASDHMTGCRRWHWHGHGKLAWGPHGFK